MIKKNVFACISGILFILFGCASNPKDKVAYEQKSPECGALSFAEVWAWVCQGREKYYSPDFPLTDVCYFSANVGTYGELIDIPKKKNLESTNARTHLVVVCEGRALTHFVLEPQFGLTDKLVDDILKAGADFDGIQIDFENIPARDYDNFFAFLKKVSSRSAEAGKIFTVCVPARIKTLKEDAFPYQKIASISDRVIIMAYDEHWSTSKPGPIASYEWCEKIADYSVSVLPKEKLVMGLPFYGRSWEDENLATARSFRSTNELFAAREVSDVRYVNTIPMAEFVTTQKVTYWFEDYYSTMKKLWLYGSKDISKVAFWRIGLEDSETWNWIKITETQKD